MKKSTRLRTLVDLARMQEQQAVKSLARAQAEINTEEQKLNQLVAFREQYLSSSQRSEQYGISISRLLDSRNFMNTISQAIQQQENLVKDKEGELQSQNSQWSQLHCRRLGMETVLEKELLLQSKLQDKREQSAIDDRSVRKACETDGMESA